jgi:hypothetical protein
MDFRYKESELNLGDVFPGITEKSAASRLRSLKLQNLHQTVLNLLMSLHKGPLSFAALFEKFGKPFEGSCHHASQAFAAALKLLSFGNVFILDCCRIDEQALKEGKLIPVQPEERFKHLGYNPYCLVEFDIGDKRFLVSPKNFKEEGLLIGSRLHQSCHAPMVGVLAHANDQYRSGVYIDRIVTDAIKAANPSLDFGKAVVWRKQKFLEQPEIFATFERKRLVGQTLADTIPTGLGKGMAL